MRTVCQVVCVVAFLMIGRAVLRPVLDRWVKPDHPGAITDAEFAAATQKNMIGSAAASVTMIVLGAVVGGRGWDALQRKRSA